MFKTTCFLALSFTLGCSSTEARRESSSAPEPTAAPSALQIAHDAYLAGDFVGTGEAVRDVLLDPSSGALAKENALELLDSAYEATNGKLPTRFKMPEGFNAIVVGAQRGVNKYSVYRGMYLWMRVKEGMGPKIDEVSLLYPDGTPILTKGAPNSRLRIKHEIPGYEDVVVNLDKMDAFPEDGVYTIQIGVGGTRVIDTWIIARHFEATSAPVMTGPEERTNDARPVVRFEPFHSPELKPFEQRSLNVWVGDSTTQEQKFNFWTASPDAQTEVHIDKTLPAGSYWVNLNGSERRSFGPIEVERGAQSGTLFNIVH